MTPTEKSKQDAAIEKPAGRVRWGVCALLFAATTVNYIDRQVIGVLKPTLSDAFHWSQTDYANIVFVFQAAYALGLLGVGWVLDRVGVRIGYASAVVLWTCAAMAHGLVAYLPPNSPLAHSATIVAFGGLSVAAFAFFRFFLGIAEAANFPAAIKAVSVWFPQGERSLATGIFNAGSNVGAIATPLLAPWVVARWGWPAAFTITGALGLLWVVFWLIFYREPEAQPRLGAAERAYILSGRSAPSGDKISYSRLLAHRQVWAFAIAKMLTDPIWWLYLFWVPDFLHTSHGLNLKDFGPPLIVIYVLADVGSVGGGWLSSALIARGHTVNFARKAALLICALCVVPIVGAAYTANLWVAVGLIGLAAAAHQGWSANLFTVASDITPRAAVSTVTGFGGMAGAVGGMVIAKIIGYVLDATHNSYVIPFTIAAGAYLAAFAVLQILLPHLEPMRIGEEPV